MAEENNTPEAETSEDTVATEATETEAPAAEAQADTQDDVSSEDEAPARDEQIIVPQPELNESLSSNTQAEDAPRKEVEGGREYEIIFITRAGNPEATDASVTRFNELVESVGGAVDNIRTSEVRRLAYTIDKEIEGIYTVANARFAATNLTEIDRFFKLEEAVLRHMILREDA